MYKLKLDDHPIIDHMSDILDDYNYDLQFLGNSRGIEAQELFNMGMIKLSIRAFGIPPTPCYTQYGFEC